MAYIKNNWVDREGTTRYFETVDSDGAKIFTPDYTQVTELGTPVNADNMNHIEEGIAAGSFTKFDLNTTYGKNDLVTVIEDGSPVIYKSLVDNNIGNALSSSIAWEKISLGGGGGGLEIGDIGIAPLGIDETKGKRRYLNGQLIIQEQYVQFTNKVKSAVALYPSLACTESEWQTTATMTVGGQVGKFVIDDDAKTIRLPKIIMPIQGLTDLSKLAEIVEAGLPTHTHTRGTMNITGTINSDEWGERKSCTGAFYETSATQGSPAAGEGNNHGVGFDASRNWTGSTSTGNYSKSLAKTDTVQQEQIQYPYFIQVATGAETEDNIINEIELNNPFSLLDYKYSEYELNNISWLRSQGQYNSKAVYPAVYDLLLKIYNGTETKAGVSVKLSTETFTDYDFVLNTAEETFRLPIKVKLASGKAVVGNGILHLSANGGAFSTLTDNALVTIGGQSSIFQGNILQASGTSSLGGGSSEMMVSSDPTKSGLELSDSDLYLYFYVGETVQNANLINAGRIEENVNTQLINKANKTDVDGQWISAKKSVFSSTTFTADELKTYDLSDILPNDGYDYECAFSAFIRTGNTSGNATGCSLLSGTTTDTSPYNVRVARCVTRAAGNAAAQGTAILPILASDRAITWRNIDSSGTSGGCGLSLDFYRRIGKNL